MTGPELVAALYDAALERPLFDRLARLVAVQTVLARDLEDLDGDGERARHGTLREVAAGGGGRAEGMVAAVLAELPAAERDELLERAAAGAAIRVHAAAVRVVATARALRADVDPDDGADFAVLFACSLSPEEVRATLAEPGEET